MWDVWGRQKVTVLWQKAMMGGSFKRAVDFAIECELHPDRWFETVIVPRGENPNEQMRTDEKGEVG